MKQAFLDNLFYALNRNHGIATKNDLYTALALTVRDRVFHRSIHTLEQYGESKPRIVAYLSAEFLPGPHTWTQPFSSRHCRANPPGVVQIRI